MYIQDLILEVTRKCNAMCAHCLRGDAQALNMSKEVIDKVLDDVSYIGNVTFTGGEPSLAVPMIKYFINQAIKRKVSISSFYVVSNGLIQSVPLMKALIDLYVYCEEKDTCMLCVSRDQYHPNDNDTPMYEALSFYSKEARTSKISDAGIISEGRASDNGLGCRSIEVTPFEVEIEDDDVRVSDMVYISSNGNVISKCDLSFDRIDEEAFGNVLTESLTDIIKKHCGQED